MTPETQSIMSESTVTLSHAPSTDGPELHRWFEETARSYYDDVYRFARSLVFTDADAEDLTQNAFLKLARQMAGIRDRRQIKRWLFRVAYCEFVDGYRHRRKFPKCSMDAEDAPVLAGVSAEQGRRSDARAALAALAEIPEHYRGPVTLFYLEDMGYREIAETLELPIGTVMSRLRRAKDLLHRRLEEPAAVPAKC